MQSSTTLDSISEAIQLPHQPRGEASSTGDSFVREIINGSKKTFAKPVKQRQGMTKDWLQRRLMHWLGAQVNQGSRLQWRSAIMEILLFGHGQHHARTLLHASLQVWPRHGQPSRFQDKGCILFHGLESTVWHHN